MGYLKLDEFEKSLCEEIAALSGYSPMTVRDVLEATFLRQIEFLMQDKEVLIPFLGKVLVRYIDDTIVAGTRVANIESFFSPSELLKRMVGDIKDGESDILKNLLGKKIKSSLQNILDENS